MRDIPRLLRARLQSLRHGHHLCLFYDGVDEQIAVSVEYIRQGLRRRERCLYVSDADAVAATRQALQEAQVDVVRASAGGELVMLTARDAHLRGGHFDAGGMIAMLGNAVRQALDDGFSGLRAAGDMSWILDAAPGTDDVTDYEALLNSFFPRSPAIGLCLYDRKRLHPLVLEGALRTHSTILIGDRCCDANPFYDSPEVYFGRVDDRQRLEWKLQRLSMSSSLR